MREKNSKFHINDNLSFEKNRDEKIGRASNVSLRLSYKILTSDLENFEISN